MFRAAARAAVVITMVPGRTGRNAAAITGRIPIAVMRANNWSAITTAAVAPAITVMTTAAGSGKKIVLTPRAGMIIIAVPATRRRGSTGIATAVRAATVITIPTTGPIQKTVARINTAPAASPILTVRAVLRAGATATKTLPMAAKSI